MRRKEKIRRKILAVSLWILSLSILIPLYFAVINSLKDKKEAAMMNLKLPTVWQGAENYVRMAEEGNILQSFVNSCVMTILSVLIIVICSSTMAFILERRGDKLARVLNIFIMIGLVLPVQIIPTYFICNALDISKRAAYICVMAATNLSLCTFLYTGYFKSIPVEIDESACLDGAGPLTMFLKIIFPLTKPVTVTVIIISFMSVWNDFGVSVYFLNNVNLQTLPLTVYNFFGNHNSDWQLVFANVVTATLPVLILYLFLQRYIIDGMVAGSVKS